MSAGAHTPAMPTLVRGSIASPILAISSFGESESGELYFADLRGGTIHRITPSAKP